MRLKLHTRFPAAAAALTLALSACAAPPEPPPPPPPPPPLPTMGLAPSVVEEASAYRAYMSGATAITPPFMDGLAIQQALKTGAAYQPRQFLRGAVAYAAIVALQDPAFVAGVRKFAGDPAQRQEVVANLVANPAYVVGMEGSDSAAGLVTKALRGDSTRLFVAGQAVKQSAYEIQHQKWSRDAVPEREARLIAAKALSSSPTRGNIADLALLQQASTGTASLNITADPVDPPYTPLVIRGLAVAALAALGQATEADSAHLDALLSDPSTAYCLNMGKLNLYQCLAVSKPHYEDVFCLGQHILMDTGQCLMKGSGAPMPMSVATQPLALPSPGASTKIVAPTSKTN